MGYLAGSSVEQCSDRCAGDTYYTSDNDLVSNAMGVRGTSTLSPGNSLSYYLPSRIRERLENNPDRDNLGIYFYDNATSTSRYSWLSFGFNRCWAADQCCSSNSCGRSVSFSIRPILSLKPDAVADPSGDGSENNPWVLVEQ